MGVLNRFRKSTALVSSRTPQAISDALTAQGMDTSATMGPGRPTNPYSGYSTRPRANDFPVGVNISSNGRAAWHRPSFDTLKAITDAYDVSRMCVNHKIDELRSMEPLFAVADGFTGDEREAVETAKTVLARPDRVLPYDSWLSKWLEGAMRYDAAPLYRRRNRLGQVIGLESLDGPTIMPYVDEHGRRPEAPAPAFYQVIRGQIHDWYTVEDIEYPLFRPQADSPFGLAPIESILLTANTDIRFQWWFLNTFTEGNIPAAYGEAPPDASSPDQVAEWQDYWDAVIEGDQTQQHKVKWVPAGTKIQPIRENSFDIDFAEYLMSRTAAAYGVVPQDLGLVKDVNRSSGEVQVDIQFRVNTLPWVRYVEGTLTRYLQEDLGLPVKVNLNTGRDKEDRVAEAEAWQIYINSGMASADEGRQELLGLPIDSARPMPRFINNPRTGPVPLASILAIAGQIDSETGAPRDDVPLSLTPFDGAHGVLADRSPGGSSFARAPINPDEPQFPELEHVVPGSDVVGTKPGEPVIGDPGVPLIKPLVKDMTAGVTSSTGITGSPMSDDVVEPVEDDVDELVLHKNLEMAAFSRFMKARRRDGRWRDFQFTTLTDREAV
jgi:hypothetical protein